MKKRCLTLVLLGAVSFTNMEAGYSQKNGGRSAQNTNQTCNRCGYQNKKPANNNGASKAPAKCQKCQKSLPNQGLISQRPGGSGGSAPQGNDGPPPQNSYGNAPQGNDGPSAQSSYRNTSQGNDGPPRNSYGNAPQGSNGDALRNQNSDKGSDQNNDSYLQIAYKAGAHVAKKIGSFVGLKGDDSAEQSPQDKGSNADGKGPYGMLDRDQDEKGQDGKQDYLRITDVSHGETGFNSRRGDDSKAPSDSEADRPSAQLPQSQNNSDKKPEAADKATPVASNKADKNSGTPAVDRKAWAKLESQELNSLSQKVTDYLNENVDKGVAAKDSGFMAQAQDSFKALGLAQEGTAKKTVSTTYKKLALKAHTDKKGGGDDSAIKNLNAAKDFLLDGDEDQPSYFEVQQYLKLKALRADLKKTSTFVKSVDLSGLSAEDFADYSQKFAAFHQSLNDMNFDEASVEDIQSLSQSLADLKS